MVAIKRSARKLAPPLCRRNANLGQALGQAENQPVFKALFRLAFNRPGASLAAFK
ncbi:MAG: hypothetical protein ACPHL9_05850 [Limisphaerales bacterium]